LQEQTALLIFNLEGASMNRIAKQYHLVGTFDGKPYVSVLIVREGTRFSRYMTVRKPGTKHDHRILQQVLSLRIRDALKIVNTRKNSLAHDINVKLLRKEDMDIFQGFDFLSKVNPITKPTTFEKKMLSTNNHEFPKELFPAA
jgi:hypothetical protein